MAKVGADSWSKTILLRLNYVILFLLLLVMVGVSFLFLPVGLSFIGEILRISIFILVLKKEHLCGLKTFVVLQIIAIVFTSLSIPGTIIGAFASGYISYLYLLFPLILNLLYHFYILHHLRILVQEISLRSPQQVM